MSIIFADEQVPVIQNMDRKGKQCPFLHVTSKDGSPFCSQKPIIYIVSWSLKKKSMCVLFIWVRNGWDIPLKKNFGKIQINCCPTGSSHVSLTIPNNTPAREVLPAALPPSLQRLHLTLYILHVKPLSKIKLLKYLTYLKWLQRLSILLTVLKHGRELDPRRRQMP